MELKEQIGSRVVEWLCTNFKQDDNSVVTNFDSFSEMTESLLDCIYQTK